MVFCNKYSSINRTSLTFILLFHSLRCQEVLLENMLLGRNIAKNAALRENVFMMTISIELRIPLFLVGKPGSSKTLAKSIVADSMHGRASEKELLKHFKEVLLIELYLLQNTMYTSCIEHVIANCQCWDCSLSSTGPHVFISV